VVPCVFWKSREKLTPASAHRPGQISVFPRTSSSIPESPYHLAPLILIVDLGFQTEIVRRGIFQPHRGPRSGLPPPLRRVEGSIRSSSFHLSLTHPFPSTVSFYLLLHLQLIPNLRTCSDCFYPNKKRKPHQVGMSRTELSAPVPPGDGLCSDHVRWVGLGWGGEDP
jgi:hypothetical protein